MATEKLTNLSVVRALLDEARVSPQKRLGQNFLVDPGVVSCICERVQAAEPELVVEIGPGLGALTQAIAAVVESVIAVEIDPRLAQGLAERLEEQPNVEIRCQDVLEFDFSELDGRSVWVVGSLPYRITTPILRHLIRHRDALVGASLITQLEVADKILHSPGKAGSALGVFVHAFADVSWVRRIGRGAFYPVPEVDSACWEVKFLSEARFSAPEGAFFGVVRTLYRNRRKMTRRALRDLLPSDVIADALSAAGVDGTQRGEALSFAQLDRLAQTCAAWIQADGDTQEELDA